MKIWKIFFIFSMISFMKSKNNLILFLISIELYGLGLMVIIFMKLNYFFIFYLIFIQVIESVLLMYMYFFLVLKWEKFMVWSYIF